MMTQFPLWIIFLFALAVLCPGQTFSAESSRVRLVGQSDLQGRDALQVVLKGNYAYVGQHRGDAFNLLTGKTEPNGTTIVDVSNPKQPRIIKHIPGYKGAEGRAVQVVEKYFDGKDYLLRNQESGEFIGFEVWDITDKGNPKLVSKIDRLMAAHNSWWDGKTAYAYLSGISTGWNGQHLIIYDLRNPSAPKFVSNWGLPGQRPGESGGSVSLHHPVISGNRAYLSYLFGGDVVILDISDKQKPVMIGHFDVFPPFSGTHTTVPFSKMKVPNFSKGIGEVRDFLVVSEESFSSGCQELRRQLYIVDATEESRPSPSSDL